MTVRDLAPGTRQRAVEVLAAALAEVGYPGSDDARLPTAAVPPRLVYRAYSLALQSVGRTACPYEEWPASLLAFHERNPAELAYWHHYFERHGIAVEVSP